MAELKKTTAIYRLMEYFLLQKEISSYDEHILREFGCNQKTLERYLKDIESSYDHIITIKKSRQKFWKLERVSDIFDEFIKNSNDISQLFLMAREFDPEIFRELEEGTLSKIAKNDEEVFLFKNSIMEEIQSHKARKVFENLKQAIKNYEYRDIIYRYDTTNMKKAIKCLKLVFMDNNWYLAFIENDKLQFMRLSFIDEVKYSSKSTYQRADISPYLEFLKNAQNSMTLFDVEQKTATIKATPSIAKYFDDGMKKFLSTQTYKRRLDDGSIIFTLEYTQPLEILTLIQRWLPDLVILEPQELRDEYLEKLESTIKNHKGELDG